MAERVGKGVGAVREPPVQSQSVGSKKDVYECCGGATAFANAVARSSSG